MEITLHKVTKTTTDPIEYRGAKWTKTTFETASGEKPIVDRVPSVLKKANDEAAPVRK